MELYLATTNNSSFGKCAIFASNTVNCPLRIAHGRNRMGMNATRATNFKFKTRKCIQHTKLAPKLISYDRVLHSFFLFHRWNSFLHCKNHKTNTETYTNFRLIWPSLKIIIIMMGFPSSLFLPITSTPWGKINLNEFSNLPNLQWMRRISM